MTRYDPFSYGQVPLNQKESAASAPDDMLFAAPTPGKAAPAAATDWDPPAAQFQESAARGGTDDALAFGQDILGEAVPAAAPKPAAAKPAAQPAVTKPPARSAAAQPAAAPARNKAMPAATPAAPAPVAVAKVEPAPSKPLVRRGPTPLPMPARATTAGLTTAVAMVTTGAATSAWLFVKVDNPVMGAIVAAAGLVGGALAWLLMRR